MNEMKFPIGLSMLEKLREDNFYYVDKTPFVKKLVNQGQYYFLSRSRRFGKSLLLDTIKQAFLGNREVFKGLYLENHWDWEKELIQAIAEEYQLTLRGELYSSQFFNLICDLKEKYKTNVVILVDEYDKPILDAVADIAFAKKMRNILRGLYILITLQVANNGECKT